MRVPNRLLAVLLAAPLAIGASGTGDAERLDAQLGAPAARAVRAVLDSAGSAGLPRSAIVNKALEGIAKGASAERVVEVVREFAGELAEARSALRAASAGVSVSDSELDAAVSALEAGLDASALTRIRRAASGPGHATMAFTVAAHLVSTGTPASQAVSTAIRELHSQ